MSEPAADRATVLSFAPNAWLSGGLLVVYLGFSVTFGLGADAPGRLLFALAAIVLAAICATDLLWRPRLRADRDGVSVRSPSLTTRIAWSDVERVGLDERRRFGLTVRSLEIDAGDRLVILGGRALGADPAVVAGMLQALRPPG